MTTRAPASGPVDVMLFMPAATFAEVHAQAMRLGVSDAALLTTSWRAARGHIATDATTPQLLSASSGAVYVALSSEVHDDALAFAEAQGRSLSWAFLKAWAMVRARVTTWTTLDGA